MVNPQITRRETPSAPTSVYFTFTTYYFTPKSTATTTVTSTQHGTVTIIESLTPIQYTSSAQSSAQSHIAQTSSPQSHIAQTSTWPPTRSGLAAICVATAAVALIIGAVAMLYFMKRRAKKLAHVRASDGSRLPNDTTELIDLGGATRKRSDSAPRSVSEHDSTAELIAGLQDLSTKIQDHVESTYSLEESQTNDKDGLVQAIARLPFLKHDAQFLAYLCSYPCTRHVTLRHLIAVTMLSAIDFSTFHDAILLPPVILAFWATLPSPHGDKQRIEALWHWQKLSMGLLQRRPTSAATITPNTELTSIQRQISKLYALLAPILSHFIYHDNNNNNGEPSHHQTQQDQTPQLHDLIITTAALGRTFLLQPYRWAFDWHNTTAINPDDTTTGYDDTYSNNRDELVIMPALVRVSDAVGAELDVPVPVMHGVVVDVSGGVGVDGGGVGGVGGLGVRERGGGRGRAWVRERVW